MNFVRTVLFGWVVTGAAVAGEPPGNGNVVIGPQYQLDPALTDQGNPQGRQFEFTLQLADSRIFPGTDSTLDPAKDVGRAGRCLRGRCDRTRSARLRQV